MPSKAELRQEWNNAGKDVVVLHQFDRAKTRPNPSPYCLKLETFLRVAAIEYKIDTTQPMGPKGKAPWITFNGTDYNDSQHCIELLMEKLEDKNIDKELSANQAAQARAVRIMFEVGFHCNQVKARPKCDMHLDYFRTTSPGASTPGR